MQTSVLVHLNVIESSRLESVARQLEKLGTLKRVHAALFMLTTNVTPRGVKSLVRSMISDTDTVCVAVITQLLVQQGGDTSDAA